MQRINKMAGFTLIELIFVIVIVGVMSVVIGKTLFQGLSSFQTAQNISEVDWQGLIAIERLANDLHTVRSPSDISTMSASQITFVNANNASVSYQLSAGLLLRNGVTLASGVSGFTLSYLNQTGAVTATASAVRYVAVTISALQGNIPGSFSTLIGIRSAA